MIKQCGNCEFWDRENAMSSPKFKDRKIAEFKFPAPISVTKTMVYEDQGSDCPVYLEKS